MAPSSLSFHACLCIESNHYKAICFPWHVCIAEAALCEKRGGLPHPCLGSTCVCLNSLLALRYVKYTGNAACPVGVYEYQRRTPFLERMADTDFAASVFQLCVRLLLL